jgi:putative RecB family exonuclease
MQGIIDRISRASDGAIEIHDYKTGARVPSQRNLDEDRQLALYQLGLSRHYGEDTEYRLVWHYVARNRTCVSTRSPEALETLRARTIARIDEIESATEFPARKISLCGWCEYKERCPEWASPETLAQLAAEGAAADRSNDDEEKTQLDLL